MATQGAVAGARAAAPELDAKAPPVATIVFAAILIGGLIYTGYSLASDIGAAPVLTTSAAPFILLGIALLIALGFEFVNGFHDTANAVATVIYTHALPAPVAVVWSGVWNFLGVLTASGAVAFGIISLLPVELILKVSSGAGFAMVFALLIAAIIWNLGTWWLGLPASSSHTLIGSIIGVGVANQFVNATGGTSGVDWTKAQEIGLSLLLSPLLGFLCAALLMIALKTLVRVPALYEEPKGKEPPPWWIRGILILTCTGVSFFHGSNDGQKGMGLIMLILIGTVPTAYALNRTLPSEYASEFARDAGAAQAALTRFAKAAPAPADPRAALTAYVQSKTVAPDTVPALAAMVGQLSAHVAQAGSLARVAPDAISPLRNDMYLTLETMRLMDKRKTPAFDDGTKAALKPLRSELEVATRFIPNWVKVAIAIALGMGTMVGWQRIVRTVGEKIGKSHLTYAQGASAEVVAASAIGIADAYGLPVSTTHVLSSGVAGTMAANRSGLQIETLRNMLLAWVLTLPMAMLLSGGLFILFSAFA